MAMEYRSPLSLFQSSLPKDCAETLMNVKFNEILKLEENTQGLFSYYMTPERTAYLFERGVYLSPNSVSPHPHPLCKTLENHFLYNLLPMYMNRTRSIIFFSCKMSKVDRFTVKNEVNVALINRIVEAKDASRYAGTHLIDKKMPLAPLIESYEQVFFHDEIHHWKYQDFRRMLSNFRGKNLNIFATAVYPVECLSGYRESMNPLCYQFEVHGDKIYFFPDGNVDGMYVQKRDTWLFGTSHIYDETGRVWTITKLNTIASHHLFMISLGEFESPDRYMYHDFTLIPMSRFVDKIHFPMTRVRSEVIKKVMIYLMSLKKPDVNSAVAKVRQLCGNEIVPDEAVFAASLAKNVTNCSFVASLGDKFGMEALFDSLFACCPKVIQRLFDKKKFFSREFLSDFNNMDPLRMTLKRSRQMSDFYDPNFEFRDSMNVLYQGDLVTMMEEMFLYGEVLNVGRTEAPYSLDYISHNFQKEKLIPLVKAHAQKRDSDRVWKEHDSKIRKDICLRLTDKSHEEMEKGRRLRNLLDDIQFVRDTNESREERERALLNRLKMEIMAINSEKIRAHDDAPGEKVSTLNRLLKSVEPRIEIKLNPLIRDEVMGRIKQDAQDEEKQGATMREEDGHDKMGRTPIQQSEDQPETEKFQDSINVELEIRSEHMLVKEEEEVAAEEREIPKEIDVETHSSGNCHCLDLSASLTLCPHDHEEIQVPGDGDCFYHTMKILEEFEGSTSDYKRIKLTELLSLKLLSAEEFEFFSSPGRWADEVITHKILSMSKKEIKVHEDTGSSCYVIGPRDKDGSRCMLSRKDHFCPLLCVEMKESDDEAEEVVNPHRFDLSKVSAIINRGLTNACIIQSLSRRMRVDVDTLLIALMSKDPFWGEWIMKEEGGTVDDLLKALKDLKQPAHVHTERGIINHEADSERKRIHLFMFKGHCSDEAPHDYKVSNFGRSPEQVSKIIEALPLCSKVKINFELERAKRLRESLLNSYTGIDSSSFKRDIKLIKDQSFYTRDVLTFLGFAGSGKSRGLMNMVSGTLNRPEVMVIVPRVNLRHAWIRSAEGNVDKMRFKCLTFETALRHLKGKKVLIIDEITLFPPGYMDLIEYLSEAENMVVLGDPLQRNYYSKNDQYYLGMTNDIEKFGGLRFTYAMYSHRLPENSVFNIKTMGRKELNPYAGKIYKEPAAMYRDMKKMGQEYNIISLSREMAATMSSYCKAGCSMTVGESQGLTFNFVVIVVDIDAKLADPKTWMVALTRSLGGYCFQMMDSMTVKIVEDTMSNSFLHKAIKNIKISEEHLINSCGRVMDEAVIIRDEMKFGADQEDIEMKLEGDPYLKGLINLVEFPFPEEDQPPEPGRHDSPPKVHLMLSPGVTYLEEDLRLKARENREFRQSYRGWSCQFNDLDDKPRPNRLNPWCSMFQAIYPKHDGMDDLTFWAAVKKRLMFAPLERNARDLEETRQEGMILFQILKETYGLKGRCINRVSEEVMDEFRSKRLSKSAKLIANHADRSDPDWSVNHFKLFMKTQLCSKFEKRYVDAKAGQTLACFSHLVLLRFGERCRQFEKDFRSDLSSNIYIHSQKNFDELNDFVKANFNSFEGTDSDFEAFDRSQDATILNLELNLLEYYGWPRDLIEDYKILKLTMGCKLGGMAIMRFTGEFGTFIFNTVANMVFTAMRYEIKRDTVLLFAGDDMCSPGVLRVIKDKQRLLDKLNLKAKVNFSREPMFCGWRLTPFGIYKEPKLILERWLIAEEKNMLHECLINYSLEAVYAYELGDKLYDLIKDVEPYQELVRKIVKKKHLLPQKVREHFESYGDDFGQRREIHKEIGGREHTHGGCGSLCSL